MALSDLQVFSEYVYLAQTEVLDQKIDVFNAASRGAITLRSAAHQGDFSDQVLWAKISGLVRRRNAYGSGTVSEKILQQLLDTSVKVAAGTPPIRIDPSMLKWIQLDPKVAGATIGQQMAGDTMADMLNAGALAAKVAITNIAAITNDVTGGTAPADLTNLGALNNTAAKFGDRAQSIVCWFMHSKPLFDLYGTALANNERLFTFGNVNLIQDGFGRMFVVSDSPSLVTTGSPNKYTTLGLQSGALLIDQNGDFTDNVQTVNGNENIQRSYQAEWSYNVGVQGFSWDKTNGGKSPNDAAIGAAGNWDKYSTSNKDLAGVALISH
jgi:hypothetical protein